MADKLQVLLIIEVILLSLVWVALVWYEVFSRDPLWSKMVAKLDKVNWVMVYLVIITGIMFLITIKMV